MCAMTGSAGRPLSLATRTLRRARRMPGAWGRDSGFGALSTFVCYGGYLPNLCPIGHTIAYLFRDRGDGDPRLWTLGRSSKTRERHGRHKQEGWP